MNKNIGVLFDLDGVLLDTEGLYTEFWSDIDKKYPTRVPHFTELIKGSNLETILNTYFQPSQHDDIVAELRDFQADMKYRFFPGAIDFLDTLKAAGIPMCIVTSSDVHKMDAVWEQHPDFRSYFDGVITGEMVSHPKPDPECFLLGAKMLGIDIGHCYIFEDSINGIDAAHAAGGIVIGLSTTNTLEALQDKAVLVIDDFKEFSIEKMLAL